MWRGIDVLEVNTRKHRTVRQYCDFGMIPRFWLKSISTDRVFVATMYTSDADKIMRYTDEVSVAERGAEE
jgi:hypothetical protein